MGFSLTSGDRIPRSHTAAAGISLQMIIVNFSTSSSNLGDLPLAPYSFRFVSFCRLRPTAQVLRLSLAAPNRHNTPVPSTGREPQNPADCATPQM
jgi:hypothetical protein